MRLGYFGGSFDPPHRAHLLAACLARDRFSLDHVLLAPTGRQPLKAQGAEAPFADRLRMVELLCAGETALQASALDGPRPDGEPNYTADTLRRLRASLATSATTPEIFAIVGADAFLSMSHWREPEALFRLAQWIVISRPGFALDAAALLLSPAWQASVHLLPELAEPVSATSLRHRLRSGEDCRSLIPTAVLDYLKSRNLYLP